MKTNPQQFIQDGVILTIGFYLLHLATSLSAESVVHNYSVSADQFSGANKILIQHFNQ